MAFADAHAAFRAGTLDAQEGTLATFAAARLDALGVKQVMLWGAVAEMRGVRGEQSGVGRLDRRSSARSCATPRCEAARELPALARAENDAALATLRKRGVTVTRLTASGRAAFAAAARGVYDKWAAVVGADLVRAAEAAVKGTATVTAPAAGATPSWNSCRRNGRGAPRSRPSSGGASA